MSFLHSINLCHAYLKSEGHLSGSFSHFLESQVGKSELVLNRASIVLLGQIRHDHTSHVSLLSKSLVVFEEFVELRVAADIVGML